jgi:hypothetical protein
MLRAGAAAIDMYESGDSEMMAYSAFRAMVAAVPSPLRNRMVAILSKLPAQ